jgi:hypothetical protein
MRIGALKALKASHRISALYIRIIPNMRHASKFNV